MRVCEVDVPIWCVVVTVPVQVAKDEIKANQGDTGRGCTREGERCRVQIHWALNHTARKTRIITAFLSDLIARDTATLSPVSQWVRVAGSNSKIISSLLRLTRTKLGGYRMEGDHGG